MGIPSFLQAKNKGHPDYGSGLRLIPINTLVLTASMPSISSRGCLPFSKAISLGLKTYETYNTVGRQR